MQFLCCGHFFHRFSLLFHPKCLYSRLNEIIFYSTKIMSLIVAVYLREHTAFFFIGLHSSRNSNLLKFHHFMLWLSINNKMLKFWRTSFSRLKFLCKIQWRPEHSHKESGSMLKLYVVVVLANMIVHWTFLH